MPGFQKSPFDAVMDEHAALVDGKWFYARIAGTDRINEDGSLRQAAIATLVPRVELHLVPEPDNAFDPNAVRVLTPAGDQVGYLEARLAGETVRRTKKGILTRAFVSNLTGGGPGRNFGLVVGILTYNEPL